MTKARFMRLTALLALLLLTAALLLTGCKPTIDPVGTATLVISANGITEEYSVPLSKLEEGKGALAALEYLKTEGKLDYKTDATGYITEVGILKQNPSKNIYVGIWTSVEKDADVSGWIADKDYNGSTLAPAGKGLSSMSLEDGCIIYIGELIYG